MTAPRPERRLSDGSILRCVVYGLAAALIPGSLATASGRLLAHDGRLLSLFGISALVAMGGALAVAFSVRGRRLPPWLRGLDVLVLNVILAVALGEVALRVAQRVAPSSLLWDDSSVARGIIDRRRCEPGLWFRYRCNSRGYPDEEFIAPGPSDYSVALLADSFGVGSVPWGHLFATLAERELRERLSGRYTRVVIDNHSVIGIDLLGYRYLYEHEIQGRGYRRVVLCFFVGNDLERPSEVGRWRRLVRIQGWLPVELARRLWLTSRGVERERSTDENALTEEPDFLEDPSREPAYFTRDAYTQIEASRALVTVAGLGYTEAQYQQAQRELDAWYEELGAQLLLVLIPDEFQVNDALWNAARELSSRRYGIPQNQYRRDYPQERIRRWAEARGARVLDLLPALREAERTGRTYHLRDSHWNAHGNRVAGHALAHALAQGETAER